MPPRSKTAVERVGMVGLGNMGGRIARRIAAADWSIAGFDVDPGAAEAAGIEPAAAAAELGARVDALFMSLPDSKVVEAVVLGDGGLLGAVAAGTVVVDLSTAAPDSTVRIQAAFAERGVDYVDAGISGGAAAAEKGTLTIMAGGSAEALDRVRPVIDSFAAKVFHMGGPGRGHVAKLLNNFLNGVSLAASAEAMVGAKLAGLDLRQFLAVVNSSSGVNFATLNRFPKIIEGDYLEGGLSSNLMAKDLRLYLELMQDLGATSFTGPPTLGTFDLANALGYGDQISNRVVDAIGDMAGGTRVQADAGADR
ncbi:MAG TPA: NAD(P)-dependent oxidoreductase [Solirubrobacterales bacterium]|nr:NAD(P)-dependent oxidoreductase [Solirubrobacterales bacterium]